MNGITCMELALEGERLCKSGDFEQGVAFFEGAIKVGTTDQRTLSAIYSQLGNAFFYLENYEKALEYHTLDLATTRSIGDEVAEAKASGNLGNTLKMLDKFDEAACHCRRHLEISKKLEDKVGEGRALYNLGYVYHTKGKRMVRLDRQNPGELPDDIRACLIRAVGYYEGNLKVVLELNDLAGVGRAYGNLGNTHYLLGNFEQAVYYHTKRLEIARQSRDRAAERRAQCNLGNANIFLGNFSDAVENYIETLRLAKEIDDKTVEAQACYSLANTYTLLRDYESAIKYHLAYLEMVRESNDRLGEGRSCWSLVNVYQMINDHESALKYAEKHLEIAREIGDQAGEATAQLNIEELRALLTNKKTISELTHGQASACQGTSQGIGQELPGDGANLGSKYYKRFSMEKLNLFRLTPDRRHEQEQRRFKKQLNAALLDQPGTASTKRNSHLNIEDNQSKNLNKKSPSSEKLMDLIAHFQSGRIDDQRCEISLPSLNQNNPMPTSSTLIKSSGVTQSDEALASCLSTVNPSNCENNEKENTTPRPLNSKFSHLKNRKVSLSGAGTSGPGISQNGGNLNMRRPTITSQHRDELFDLIAGAQGQRMEEQRASLPAFSRSANGVLAGISDHTNRNIAFDPRPDLIPPVPTNHHLSPAPNSTQSRSHKAIVAQLKHRSESMAPTCSASHSSNITSKQRDKEKEKASIDAHANEKFFDLLIKCQSTRLDDQRVSLGTNDKKTTTTSNTNSTTDYQNQTQDQSKNSNNNQEQTSGISDAQGEKSTAQNVSINNPRLSQRSSSVCVSGMAPANSGSRGERKTPNDSDDFFNLILRIQSNRLDDQRSNLPSNSQNSNNQN